MRWIPALLATMLLFGCSEADAPGGSGRTPGGGDLPCEPACRDGFACDDGVCIPACSPECPAGTLCQPDGSCAADADDLGDLLANPCGGTASLEGLPGEACGPCGDGRWLCATDNEVVCVDPVGLNICGGCGALPGEPGEACDDGDDRRWACAPDTTLACADAVNACGGTEALDALPGRPCGTCNAGTWACVSPNAVQCREPDDPPDAATCTCDPDEAPWLPCGTDAGACTRGMRPCLADGTVGPCVDVPVGGACSTDADCGSGTCVTEVIDPFERLDDDCRGLGDDCTRRTCREPFGAVPCTADSDCQSFQACAAGMCMALASPPTDERCNGIDDDCDGRIDNDERRFEICGVCPFNTLLITNAERDFGRRRICMDVTEASRPDATDLDAGTVETHAQPVFGVVPWTDVTADEAIAACAGDAYNAQVPGGVVQRRLCIVDEWQLGCNAEDAAYPYGDAHVAGACADASLETGGLLPTASLDECTYIQPRGRFPHWDVVGNAAEWVRGDSGVVIAGGSWQSTPEEATCRATRATDADTDPAVGFRCCATPLVGNF